MLKVFFMSQFDILSINLIYFIFMIIFRLLLFIFTNYASHDKNNWNQISNTLPTFEYFTNLDHYLHILINPMLESSNKKGKGPIYDPIPIPIPIHPSMNYYFHMALFTHHRRQWWPPNPGTLLFGLSFFLSFHSFSSLSSSSSPPFLSPPGDQGRAISITHTQKRMIYSLSSNTICVFLSFFSYNA